MRINSIAEFLNFVRSNGLTNIAPDVAAFTRCMEEFQRMCPCDPDAAKRAKIGQCRAMYINFVNRSAQFKDALLSKSPDGTITFGVDNQVITTLSR